MRKLVTIHVRGGNDIVVQCDDDEKFAHPDRGRCTTTDDYATVEHKRLSDAISHALAAAGWGPTRIIWK